MQLKNYDLGKALQKMSIVFKLKKSADRKTELGKHIIRAINDITISDSAVIEYVRSQALDNVDVMCKVIPEDLVIEILNL